MIYHGYEFPKEVAKAKHQVRTWFADNNVPENVQEEILDANGYDYEDAWDYVQELCPNCHTEDECEKFDCYSMDV